MSIDVKYVEVGRRAVAVVGMTIEVDAWLFAGQ
jgi:hypothetical protein